MARRPCRDERADPEHQGSKRAVAANVGELGSIAFGVAKARENPQIKETASWRLNGLITPRSAFAKIVSVKY
jgi:hypothetical protein